MLLKNIQRCCNRVRLEHDILKLAFDLKLASLINGFTVLLSISHFFHLHFKTFLLYDKVCQTVTLLQHVILNLITL